MNLQALVSRLRKEFKTVEDAKLIHENIKVFSFFQKFINSHFSYAEDEATLHLCKNMFYEKHEPGSIIMTEGEKSNDKFYIVLTGEVDVFVKNPLEVGDSEYRQTNFFQSSKKKHNSIQKLSKSISKDTYEELEKKLQINLQSENINDSFQNITKEKASIFKRSSTLFMSLKDRRELDLQMRKMSISHLKEQIQIFGEMQENSNEKYKKISLNAYMTPNQLKSRFLELGYKNKNLVQGESFGEIALIDSNAKRTATIIALKEVELVVVLKKDFLMMREKFSKEYKRKKKFVINVLPFLKSIASPLTLDNFIFRFQQKNFSYRCTVVREDESLDQILFLMKGKCRIEKNVSIEYNQLFTKKNIHLCHIDQNSVIGEEILFSKDGYGEISLYTVTVASDEATFLYIKKSEFTLDYFSNELKNYLFQNFKEKEKNRQKIIATFKEAENNFDSRQTKNLILGVKYEENKNIITNMNKLLKQNYFCKLKNSVEKIKMEEPPPDISMFHQVKQHIAKKISLRKIEKELKNSNQNLKNLVSYRNSTIPDQNEVISSIEIQEIGGLPEEEKANLNYHVRERKTEMEEKKEEVVRFDFGNNQKEDKMDKIRKLRIKMMKPALTQSFAQPLKHEQIFRNRIMTAKSRKNEFLSQQKGYKTAISLSEKSLSNSNSMTQNRINENNEHTRSKGPYLLKRFLKNSQVNNLFVITNFSSLEQKSEVNNISCSTSTNKEFYQRLLSAKNKHNSLNLKKVRELQVNQICHDYVLTPKIFNL